MFILDPCASFPCGDRECRSINNAAVCTYPDTDIHCGFETHENGCQADVEFFGKFHSHDDSDWTLYSGQTLTSGTGRLLLVMQYQDASPGISILF